MDDLRIIDLKDLFFYLCFSWRTILVSVLICCLLAGGITYLRPAQMTTKEAAETAREEVKFPDKLILTPPPYSYTVEDTEDPFDRYSALEVQQMIMDFSKSDVEAKPLYEVNQNKEKENLDLQESLDSSPYLNIDPKHRVNKRLRITLRLEEDSSLDPYSAAFLRQNLCSAYLSTLRDGRFFQTMAEDFSITYKSDEIKRLIQLNLDSPNTILVKITAPDEEQRELLFDNCKQEIQRLYDEGAATYIKHTLSMEELSDETVSDTSIVIEREAVKLKIKENEELIRKNTKEIEGKFYTNFANKVMLARSKKNREKAEAIKVLQEELKAAGASEKDCERIASVIKNSMWDPSAISQIKDSFLKTLAYDREQEKLNLQKQIQEAEKKQADAKASNETEEDAEKLEEKTITAFQKSMQVLLKEEPKPMNAKQVEIELVPLPKRYKRNVVLGFLLGIFLSGCIVLLKYWRKLFDVDLQTVCDTQNVTFLGSVSFARIMKKNAACFLDCWICRMFGKTFDEGQQHNDLACTANAILAKVDNNDNVSAYKLIVPGIEENKDKFDLLEKIKTLDGNNQIEWIYTQKISQSAVAIEALKNADAILFVGNTHELGAELFRDVAIARNMNKKVLGVIKLRETYQFM